MQRSLFTTLTCAGFIALSLGVSVAKGQGTKKTEAKSDEIQKLRERIEKLEAAISRLKGTENKIPAEKQQQQVMTLMESPYIGSSYSSSAKYRFFVTRLLYINLTTKPATIKRDDIQLSFNGKIYKQIDIPTQMKYQSFTVGSQSYTLRNLTPKPELKIPVGGTGSSWVVFPTLPNGGDIPKLKLNMLLAGKKKTIDVNDHALGLLNLKVEQIGPHGSLGLLSISGTINTINAGGLVDAIDQLVKKKVARFVIRWTKSAPTLNSTISSWLQNSANNAGRGSTSRYGNLPIFPASIRELHLAHIPSRSSSTSTTINPLGTLPITSTSSTLRVHKTDVAAIMFALKSAYELIPRDELLKDIQTGHPLTRVAALAGGGGRLSVEQLPIILKYADHADPKYQQAALMALRHFGEKKAIEKLVYHAKKNTPQLGSIAIFCLAASRYSAAHQALLEILKNEPPKSRIQIVKILASYPRPIWSDTIYSFVKDPNSGVGIEALRALSVIGHPKLVDVLENSLEKGNSTVKQEAYRQLSLRTDNRSERIAMDYTLKLMEKSPPTSQMYTLIRRTKDPRTIPLLLKHLNGSSSSRSTIIGVLGQIGDQTVGDKLVVKYSQLKSEYERAAILRALVQLKSTKVVPLAGAALMTRNSSLISAACEVLRTDGSKQSVKLMIDAFENSTYSSAWSYTSSALSQIGTPAIKDVFRRARTSTNSSKRNYAVNALRSIMQRSPGYQYIYQAKSYSRQKKHKEAESYYSMAIKLDAKLSVAYSGRGHTYLRMKKVKEAKADFTTAVKLDPYDSLAVTGLGVVLTMEGKYIEGIKQVEDSRSKFPTDTLFAYNTACVYGRALTTVKKEKKSAERDKKITAYRDKSLAELRRAVKMGYRNYTDMKIDPDLASLKDDPEFKNIYTPPGSVKKPGIAPGKKAVPFPAAKEAPKAAADIQKKA